MPVIFERIDYSINGTKKRQRLVNYCVTTVILFQKLAIKLDGWGKVICLIIEIKFIINIWHILQ